MKKRAVAFNPEVGNVKLPADIPALGAFDLDDPRPKIGQTHGRGRAREKLREVENKETFERFHRIFSHSFAISRAASVTLVRPATAA